MEIWCTVPSFIIRPIGSLRDLQFEVKTIKGNSLLINLEIYFFFLNFSISQLVEVL